MLKAFVCIRLFLKFKGI